MRAATQLTRASRPFSLNQTGTRSRRHLAHFVAAVDTRAVEKEKLQAIFALGAEDENVAAVGIALQTFDDERDETVYAFTKIDRPRRNKHPSLRVEGDHRLRRSAAINASSAPASAPGGTRIVASAIVTSITDSAAGVAWRSAATATLSRCSSSFVTRIGVNTVGPSKPTSVSRASRR